MIGISRHDNTRPDDGDMEDAEHQSFLRSLPALVPEARVFEFSLFQARAAADKNVLSDNDFSKEASILLKAIRRNTATKNKWTTVLLVGYGLGGIIIKQVRSWPSSVIPLGVISMVNSDIVAGTSFSKLQPSIL
ncbi:hypothetical protein F4820DRAFT_315493 [Hypoxylon rubiginosum]|uniref:Uncharacterized protein n=1 Tax=Hypoxylon rubiginosum TaxID=110542 RepID=A0ACB9Z0W7_9PEZI|nr:hypothetical protein F4820DRAFT_315493 [Hypoxylon rubiginosum]